MLTEAATAFTYIFLTLLVYSPFLTLLTHALIMIVLYTIFWCAGHNYPATADAIARAFGALVLGAWTATVWTGTPVIEYACGDLAVIAFTAGFALLSCARMRVLLAMSLVLAAATALCMPIWAVESGPLFRVPFQEDKSLTAILSSIPTEELAMMVGAGLVQSATAIMFLCGFWIERGSIAERWQKIRSGATRFLGGQHN